MKNSNTFFALAIIILMLCACNDEVKLATGARADGTFLFPDYAGVTVPVNIAPLNFHYCAEGLRKASTTFSAGDVSVVVKGVAVVWKPAEWKRIMDAAAGGRVDVRTVLSTKSGERTEDWSFDVLDAPVDPYLTYRLIEPGYEVWDDVEIVERCIENYDEKVLSDYRHTENKCMNCHIHSGGRGDLSMFYVRGNGGGAILNRNGELRKLNLRDSAMISSTVYGEIHPEGRYGVFSTNIIIPGFHSEPGLRLEVFDTASDLCVADFDSNRMTVPQMVSRPDVLETFPAFSADGRSVYYCAAPAGNLPDGIRDLKYSLVRVDFDPQTGEMGPGVDTLRSAALLGGSVCHPKASPDGRWLMYTVADYGTFPIWHRECDLEMIDLSSGNIVPLEAVSADRSDTYHSWSSDSGWFVFASKRGDGQYGKPYFSHIDSEGRSTKPFVLPQKDPYFYDRFLRSFNIPDLGKTSVGFDAEVVGQVWKNIAAEPFE